MNFIRFLGAFLVSALVAGCGGGGGGAGTSSFGSGSGNGLAGNGTTGTGAQASLILSISSTSATASAPSTVVASLKDASGAAVGGQVVTFTTAGGLGAFNVASALTDANGAATVKLSPASASANGADLVVAKATVGTATITGTIGFQVAAGTGSATPAGGPSISLALSTAAVSSATPATATAVVKDANGAGIPGQVVKFSTASTGIGSFAVASALTDATGTATGKLNPASSSANGADLAIAQATVNGTLITGSVGFSVASTGGATSVGVPSISLALSTTTVTTAAPATVSATVRDATGAAVAGQVVKFATVDGLGVFPTASALTNAFGVASVTLSAAASKSSGADQVIASAAVNGTALQASQGFQLTASSVQIASFSADVSPVAAYGQTNLTVTLTGTTAGVPATVAVASGCVASGRASLTPATVATTTGTALFTYRDLGCGASSTSDTLQATVTGTSAVASSSLGLTAPTPTSISFISASPQNIFLKGSGFGETSTVLFRVVDQGGVNGVAGKSVLIDPSTLSGGLTIDGVGGSVTKTSDSNGDVSVLIRSGTVPTPVRVKATLVATPTITTVSSNLAIAVGLPSQLNFSLSQQTINIEAGNLDGIANTYNIIASDRLGNPVPAGTAINFVSEAGQIEPIKLTTLTGGLARISANFLSSSPRPADGRVTVLAYALGEESFFDTNGNNVWDSGEPFQDLGNAYLDRLYNNLFESATDQFFPLAGAAAAPATCVTATGLLQLDASIPSAATNPNSGGASACDGTWGRAYVRRAVETVFSTSSARPMWNSGFANLYASAGSSCAPQTRIIGYDTAGSALTHDFIDLGQGHPLYNLASPVVLSFLAADANPVRINPMAAGTTISATGTTGLTVSVAGGSPVPNTGVVSAASVSVAFGPGVTDGTVTITFTSPSGLATSVSQVVSTAAAPGGAVACP